MTVIVTRPVTPLARAENRVLYLFDLNANTGILNHGDLLTRRQKRELIKRILIRYAEELSQHANATTDKRRSSSIRPDPDNNRSLQGIRESISPPS